ncbi:MAG TPA: 50S ribosomal protein L32 [Lentisphaeria bacterium]|nr:50S ribosomal protein L32 [Lentisphaeria bacterium]
MAVQQHKVSKRKCRQRKATHRYQGNQSAKCPECEAPKMPHRICPGCGHYKSKQYETIVVD